MIKNVSIESDLLFANPLPNNVGYTWTLVSRLGDMLHLVEKRYGPRDQSYTILGIEFSDEGPQIWYPQNCGMIVIQLSISCLTNLPQAYYQMAHECIHLLSPSGGRNTNILEEGLATYFARSYVRDVFRFEMQETIASYTSARLACERLLNFDYDSISKLRLRQPAIRLISAQDIIDTVPVCPPDLAGKLTNPFVR